MHRRTAANVVLGACGIALCFGILVSDTGAAEPQKTKGRSIFSKPIQWLKNRSAEKRYRQIRQDVVAEPLPNDADRRIDPPVDSIKSTSEEPLPGFETINDDTQVQLVSDEEFRIPLVPQNTGRGALLEAAYQGVAANDQLKKVTSILPYADYQPESSTDESGIDPSLLAPSEVALGGDEVTPRTMEPILYQWRASNHYHYPLYFEDPALERYGHEHDELIQPFASIGQFGLQLVGLPYQMTIDPVWKKRYTLGWYRPGDTAPKQIRQIPLNKKAALNQAAVTTGFWFALP